MSGEIHYSGEDALAFRAIIDAAPIAIQIVGPNGVFIDCNEQTVKMFGASSQKDIIGKPPSILSPQTQPDGSLSNVSATRYIEQAINGTASTFEWEHSRLSGEVFPARVTLSPIVFQKKNCIMASICDLTAEKELLIKTKQTDEVLSLFYGTSSGMMIVGTDLQILDINPAFERITGYSRDQGLHMTLKDFQVIERKGATVTDVIAAQKPQGGSMVITFPSGVKHVEYLYIPVIDTEGKVTKLFEVFSDQTAIVNSIHEADTVIAGNPAAIITTDLNGKILSVNPSFLELTLLPEDKLLSMSISDFNIIAREGGTIAELMKSKESISGNMTVDFGTFIKILKYRYVPVIDVNGTISCLVLMYIDITDQIQKIDEITTFITHSPYGIITITPELKVLDINPAFVEITGYTRDQGLNMSLHDFKIKERSGGNLADVTRTGKPVGGRMIIDLPTGIKHLMYTYVPIIDRKGEIGLFYEIFNDVTNLVNKVNEFKSLISLSPASILTINPEGKILTVNQAFIDICQISQEKLLTMNIRDFNIIDRSGGSMADVLATKKPATGRLTADFGSFIRILDFTYIPVLDADGKIYKLVTMYIDLTEQVQMVTYLDDSVDLIAESINRLASGDTTFTTKVIDTDDTTRKAYENMVKISSALDIARDAVSGLVSDITSLAEKAVAGNLSFRADAPRHSGDYRKVIEGVNRTMDSITEPVNEAMRVATSYASYNFNTRVDPAKGMIGDWASFRKALDAIGEQVGEAIRQINIEVKNLRENSDLANNNVVEIAHGAGQLAKNAGAVSSNADQGKDGISQVLRAMEDLSVTVGEVSQKTEQVATLSQDSNQLARTGSELANKADEGMKIITVNAEETRTIINEIQQEMGQIGKIVRLITDIASQTNLLALNAAIEAARAGDAGRGFAVVAAEVKALATESRSSAENIAEMIASLQKKSENASKAVSMATDAVQEGNTALNETLAVFGQLASAVEEISTYMEQVASMSEEQAANAEEITASVNEVSDLMQNTANEAMNIAGVSEETSASLDKLKGIMTDVSSVANAVTKAINQFQI